MDGPALAERVAGICLGFPEVTERLSHGARAFFVGRQFVAVWPRGHHDRGYPHLWCAAPPGAQEMLISSEPDRIFRPPYVGHRGWIGVRLDVDVEWDEIAELCEDAYRMIAPKRLIVQFDGG